MSDKYHSDKNVMEKIQRYTFKYGLEITLDQQYDTDFVLVDHNILYGIEVPFLKKVKEISKLKSDVVTLEIAAGPGYVSWKVPFAFEKNGTHFVNDLSSEELDSAFKLINTTHLIQPNLKKMVFPLPGSCFDILDMHPKLKNGVDIIYVQNLEHFLNPIQHKNFLVLIEKLLKPGGYVFLCSLTPYTDELRKASETIGVTRKNGDEVYSMFLRYDEGSETYKNGEDGEVIYQPEIFNITVENDNVNCTTTQLGSVTQYVKNFFTPEIYRKAISKYTNLEVETAFLLDVSGTPDYEESFNPKASHYAVAIAKKKSIRNCNMLSNFFGLCHEEL